jgi:hypothetical protein
MAQPQISLTDYFGGKSIVLRSDPEDFFKPYSTFLTQFSGKWNDKLKNPTDTGKLAGWIFPKTREDAVRQGLTQILSGQVPAQAVYTAPTQNQSLLTVSNPTTLQQMLSTVQARTMGQSQPVFEIQNAVPVGPLTIPNVTTPLIPQGYQQVTYIAIKPVVGQTLQLNIAGQKIPVAVESVEVNNDITNQAIVVTPDGQRTMIRLNNDQWSIPNYQQGHSISLQ